MYIKTILNYTPHPIHLHVDNVVIDIPVSGNIYRLTECTQFVDNIQYKDKIIPITKTVVTHEKIKLPEYRKGTILIVSRLVAIQFPERFDLFYPNDIIRDSSNKILGCRSLSRFIK